jgi:hypothetical protein
MNELPWRTERSFSLWRYGIGHSRLMLHSRARDGHPGVSIMFDAVELIKLTVHHPELVLREAYEHEAREFRDVEELREPLLRLALESPGKTGFVACSSVSAREVESPVDQPFADGRLIMHVRAE